MDLSSLSARPEMELYLMHWGRKMMCSLLFVSRWAQVVLVMMEVLMSRTRVQRRRPEGGGIA